jgi:hypothetical protein
LSLRLGRPALAASGLCDAVVVASPNFTHAEVLKPLMATGLGVLVVVELLLLIYWCLPRPWWRGGLR